MHLLQISVILITFNFVGLFGFNPFEDTTEMDYMSNAYSVRTLALVEQKLLKELVSFKKSLETKLDVLNGYMGEILSEMQSSELSFTKIKNISLFDKDIYSEEASGHLFKSLHVLQRFHKVVPEISKDILSEEPEKSFKNSVKKLRGEITFPTNKDVLQSMLSIIRLTQTYKLNAEELLKGKLLGLATKSGLCLNDTLQLGIVAFRMQAFPMCFDFLETTLRHARTDPIKHSATIKSSEKMIRLAIKKHDAGFVNGTYISEQNPFHFESELKSFDSDSFRNKIPIKILPDFTNLSDTVGIHAAFEALCSGHQLRHPSVSKKYTCELVSKSHPYFTIQPLKIEYLNEDPIVILVHDALSDIEVDQLRGASEPKLKRSKVAGKNETSQTDFGRTSSNTWYADYEPSNEFNFIPRRVEMMVQLRVNYFKATEDLQVANYGPGGLYASHYDVAREEDLAKLNKDVLDLYSERGDRIATFMFYLSEPERGGGTAFPAIGISVQPVKGSAVFWYNLHNNGTAHLRTLHGGCPVLLGSKWIANKWIRSHEQMFIRKCKIHREQ